ncbi:MAG: DUF3575 domain-containing protein [Rikenellaceae bacterium]
MNNTKVKLIVRWALGLVALLCCEPLSAQRTSYTSTEFKELIEGADTIIYIYDSPAPRSFKEMLAFENQTSSVDWLLEPLPRRVLFAVKTNLLYDAVTAVNLEVEVPIGQRYSVAGEWIFPWWLSDSRQRCLEILCGTVEGRYWFGDRSEMELLTGWAAGLYAGVGYYDVEWDGKGYQGENVFAGGLSATYAHSIGRDLRLEYSMGVGILTTKYRKYTAQWCGNDWNLLRTSRGTKLWFGPTRCRVSLSWMLHRADKRGGER